MVDAETNQIVQQRQHLEAGISMAPTTQGLLLSNGAASTSTKPQSPAARLLSKPKSPAALTKNLMPHSPMLRELTLPYKV